MSDDNKKVLEKGVTDLETAIVNSNEVISTTKDEIAALEDGIKALDKEVAETTENRKEENAEYTKSMASDAAAKEPNEFGNIRLNEFYKPPAEFAQVRAHRDAPPPPPEDIQAYGKKIEQSNGIIAMMDSLIKDLDKEMTEAEVEEKDAQGDHEDSMDCMSSKAEFKGLPENKTAAIC